MRVLGPVRAVLEGTELPLGGAKPRLVLALLAARAGRTVSTEALIDGVWGEDPPPTARKALQVHVAGLRRALRSPDTIATTAGGYELVADVDAERFTAAIESARRLAEQTPAAALTHLELALSLWLDEPFADLTHEEALAAERTRLQTLRAEADGLRFRCLLELGHHDEVAAGLDVAVRAEPYREDLRIMQMLALYRSGRQVDALRVYSDARHTLAEELGVSPSPELDEMERRILEHDPSLIVPPAAESPAASTLPSRVAGLIGREQAVAETTRLLDTARLVTLTAVGGAGKTRLAIECAHRIADAFPGGTFFVDLTSVTDDDDVAVTVSAGIGLTATGREIAPTRLVEYLGPRRCLVVLDNCEHVLEGAAALAARLTDRCPQLALLATSREALAVPGEQVVQVPLLEASDARSPGVELFAVRAGEASPGFRLGDDIDIVVDICSQLDGIPLAIELAAARARSMSPTEIRDRLVDRFALLAGHRRNPTRHHRTLLAAVDWSYSLLDPDEQALLRRLAVFHGGFDLADVADVTGFDDAEAARLVDSLVGKSLVDVVRRPDGTIQRRRLLDTIRSFAAMRLDAADEATAVRDRHFEHFVGGALARSYIASTHDAEIFDRNVRELANIVAAIEHGIASGRGDATLAAIVLFWPLVERGMIDRYLPFPDGGAGLTRQQRALVLTGQMMHAYLVSDPTLVPAVPADLVPSTDQDVLDDIFHPLTGPIAFAPVEGAGPRLALLDDLLPHAARSPTPAANVACARSSAPASSTVSVISIARSSQLAGRRG